LRWLAARLEMLGGPVEPTVESHAQAVTRAILARAIRVMATAIERLDDRIKRQAE